MKAALKTVPTTKRMFICSFQCAWYAQYACLKYSKCYLLKEFSKLNISIRHLHQQQDLVHHSTVH